MLRIKDQGFFLLGAWTPIHIATSKFKYQESRLDRQVPKESRNVRGGGVEDDRQGLVFFFFSFFFFGGFGHILWKGSGTKLT